MSDKFYAVTVNPHRAYFSLFLVRAGNEGEGNAVAEKIGHSGSEGSAVGLKIESAEQIQIHRHLLACSKSADGAITWNRGTSQIVALFLEQDKAEACLAEQGLAPCDARFVDETLAVLDEVGEENPLFKVGKEFRGVLMEG